MKLRFLKDHPPHKKGDVADVGASRASKLLWRCIAEYAGDTKPVIETAAVQPVTERMVVRKYPVRVVAKAFGIDPAKLRKGKVDDA